MEAFKQLKKYAVVVYINTKKPKSKSVVSPVVMGVLNAKSMGNIIPKAVVTSPDQMTYMASISYKSMNDKAFRAANAKVKDALAGNSVAKLKDAHDCWTIASNGRYYLGEFVELKGDKTLILKSPQGKKIRVGMSQLTTGAQAYARFLAGGGEESATTEAPEMEAWESAKGGKSIRAIFISLDGEMITLKKEDGKTVKFKLSLLSAQSQKRAKELAGQ